jgi:hypothetical protein
VETYALNVMKVNFFMKLNASTNVLITRLVAPSHRNAWISVHLSSIKIQKINVWESVLRGIIKMMISENVINVILAVRHASELVNSNARLVQESTQ